MQYGEAAQRAYTTPMVIDGLIGIDLRIWVVRAMRDLENRREREMGN